MGNVDHGQVVLLLQLLHELEDLNPHGRIQHGDWLVGNDQTWVQDLGAGNDHPLLLPAAEHVGGIY